MLTKLVLAGGCLLLVALAAAYRLLRGGKPREADREADHPDHDPIEAAVNDELEKRGFTDQPPTGRPRGDHL
jgi:hypothetical protein